MVRLKVPTWLTIGLSLVAGLLAYLNITTFGLPIIWQNLVTFGLAALASVGIAPLTGPSLQNLLHISHAAALAFAAVITTACAGITTLDIDQVLKAVIIGILTALAGMLIGGAGPGVTPTPIPAQPRPIQ